MALDQSALLEVLDALKAADVGDRVRPAAETVYQVLIEAKLTDTIGAALHERSEHRTNPRKGHPPAHVVDHGRGIWSYGSRNCAPTCSSRPCSNAVGGWTRRCSRW